MLFTPVVDVKHRPYCGPVAISALTGVPVARIEKMIRRIRNDWNAKHGRKRSTRKYAIRGTGTHEVKTVLQRLGCKVENDNSNERTFGRFVDDTATVPVTYLVEVTGHWMATFKGVFCDTSSIDGPRTIEGYAKAKRRVQRVYRVSAPSEPRYSLTDPLKPAPREKKPKRDIKEVRAERLAAQIAFWVAKEKRAKTALKKLRPKLRRYQKLGVVKTA